MRLMTALFRNSRHPQCENKVPIKPTKPLKLQEWISGKNSEIKERGCWHELNMLLACLEENEFENNKCVPQLGILQKCYTTYTKNMQSLQQQQEHTEPVPYNKNLTHKQIGYMLRRYPTV